ncbi:ABC transporter ATP-binding protein [Natronospirillum operosum]|nr:ABC transporter ATP-binding protein [Natronospirillum operosum]
MNSALPRHRLQEPKANHDDSAAAQPAAADKRGSMQNADPAPLLQLQQLTKRYRAEDAAAVQDVSFDLHEGEILALLGPSGCGKTTTLRMIAGFETPDAGDVLIHGRSVLELAPRDRHIGVVFQDYALFPHLNLLRNVMFGMQQVPRAQRAERAREWLQLVGLATFAERMPDELSGGQQQRAALARTLAAEPRLVLLDEPFSNLDAALRESTRIEVRQLLKKAGTTAILVTHDQAEALSFADRVGVMQAGRLCQTGTPETVYHVPETAFVAEFLGHTNLLPCLAQGRQAQSPLGEINLSTEAQGEVMVSLRPEHLSLEASPASDANCEVISREFRGHDNFYRVQTAGTTPAEYKVLAPYDCVLPAGAPARLTPRQPGVILRG